MQQLREFSFSDVFRWMLGRMTALILNMVRCICSLVALDAQCGTMSDGNGGLYARTFGFRVRESSPPDISTKLGNFCSSKPALLQL